jgi:hypothetical protein
MIYTDESEPMMTADSMEKRIEVFAAFARERAEEQDQSIDDAVHEMTHESYLMKHTTGAC